MHIRMTTEFFKSLIHRNVSDVLKDIHVHSLICVWHKPCRFSISFVALPPPIHSAIIRKEVDFACLSLNLRCVCGFLF